MRIHRTHDGTVCIMRADGQEIITQYGSGERYATVYAGTHIITDDRGRHYRYRHDGRMTHRFGPDSHYEQWVFDPYANTIGYWKAKLTCWETRYIRKYKYKTQSDGSVRARHAGDVNYDNYDNWLADLPTEFEVAPYVEPEVSKVQYTASGQIRRKTHAQLMEESFFIAYSSIPDGGGDVYRVLRDAELRLPNPTGTPVYNYNYAPDLF